MGGSAEGFGRLTEAEASRLRTVVSDTADPGCVR